MGIFETTFYNYCHMLYMKVLKDEGTEGWYIAIHMS